MVVFFVEFQDRSYYRKVTFMSFFDCWPWVFFIFMAILRLLYVKKVTDIQKYFCRSILTKIRYKNATIIFVTF